MSTVKEYSSDDVVIAWGPHIISGKGAGDFVKVSMADDRIKSVQGADGEIGLSVQRHMPLATCEVTLLQTSSWNAVLSAEMEKARVGLGGIMPMTIKDLRGATFYLFDKAWLKKSPDGTFGKEVKERTWTFEGPCQQVEGGN